jgi:hypothetical protein
MPIPQHGGSHAPTPVTSALRAPYNECNANSTDTACTIYATGDDIALA